MQERMQNMMKETGMGSMPEMCMKMMQQMAGTAQEFAKATSHATPELNGLFEEWIKNTEEEILSFIKEKIKVTPREIAEKTKLSEESVLYLITKLAKEGKIAIGEIRIR